MNPSDPSTVDSWYSEMSVLGCFNKSMLMCHILVAIWYCRIPHPRRRRWRDAWVLLLFVKLYSFFQFFEARSVSVYFEKGVVSTLQFRGVSFSGDELRNPTFLYAANANFGNVRCTAQDESSLGPISADVSHILAAVLCIDTEGGPRSGYIFPLRMKHVFFMAKAYTSTPHRIIT